MRREDLWLWSLLVVSCLAFLFQLVPSAWWTILDACWTFSDVVDVRGWSWRSYAVVSVITIVVLIVIRAWQDNGWNRR